MIPDRQQLIRDSWRALEPNGARLVELALLHLLQIAPAARPLMRGHSFPCVCRDVASILDQLIVALDEPKQFVPLAIGLGRANPDHGINAALYPAMGEALLWALHLQLGEAFTPELQTAWLEYHHLVSAVMRRAEQSRTGEIERFRTGEFAAFQSSVAKEAQLSE